MRQALFVLLLLAAPAAAELKIAGSAATSGLPAEDARSLRPTDAEAPGDLRHRVTPFGEEVTHLLNQAGRVASHPMPLAGWHALRVQAAAASHAAGAPTLGIPIPGVVKVGAKKEMIWVDACRVVAVMANAHSFSDGPAVQYPRRDMRPGVLITLHADSAVAAQLTMAFPDPAARAVVFGHLGEEAVLQAFPAPLVAAFGTTVFPEPAANLHCGWDKITSALRAHPMDWRQFAHGALPANAVTHTACVMKLW
jgi:hypothetical protein